MKGRGKHTFARSDRVGSLMRNVLSDILRRDIKDPRLEMVTITDVRVSTDLKYARIFFSTRAGAKNINRAKKAFENARGFIKKTLASQVELRYIPELSFVYDESFDYGTHIDHLLRSVDIPAAPPLSETADHTPEANDAEDHPPITDTE